MCKEWCFTCGLEDLLLKAKEGKSPLSPIHILSQLQKIGTQLGSGRKEDAHKFLRCAIDKMQSVCLKEAGVSVMGLSEEETTLIGLTFGGYLQSKIKCMKCHYKSECQERMMDLAVEIEGEIGKLEDADDLQVLRFWMEKTSTFVPVVKCFLFRVQILRESQEKIKNSGGSLHPDNCTEAISGARQRPQGC